MWVGLFMAADIFIGSLSLRGVGLIQRSSDSDKYLWRYEFILIMELLSSQPTTHVGSEAQQLHLFKHQRCV